MRIRRVAVVGAGLSGLTAANTLSQLGFEVRVYEKSRGCGGRMATRRSRHCEFDHGAQYFTARAESFKREAASWVCKGIVKPWEGRFAIVGPDGIHLETKDSIRYVGVPGMSSLVRKLSEGLRVKFNTRISGLMINDGSWRLISESKTIDRDFDAVVLAIPPLQAAVILNQGMMNPFPQLQETAMFPCWAVMAVFESTLEVPFDAAVVKDSSLSWSARNSSKPKRREFECWILHGAPEWSQDHFDADPAWISEQLLSKFSQMARITALQPTFVQAHRWRFAQAVKPLARGCFWDPESRIGVCGDWCQESRVEGAYLSGAAVAEKIIESPEDRISKLLSSAD